MPSLGTKIRNSLKNKYWEWRGFQPLSIAGVTAEFNASNVPAKNKIKWMFRFERQLLAEFVTSLSADDVVYDIGANLGIYAAFAAQVVSDGMVVAIEPDPKNVAYLRQNLARTPTPTDVVEVALSDEWGNAEFRQVNDGVGSQVGRLATHSDGGTFQVDTVPGDGLLDDRDLPQPTVVKLDVEGAEPLVLEGMRDTLSDSECRLLFCEVHVLQPDRDHPSIQEYGSSLADIRAKLTDYGFDLRFSDCRQNVVHLVGEK